VNAAKYCSLDNIQINYIYDSSEFSITIPSIEISIQCVGVNNAALSGYPVDFTNNKVPEETSGDNTLILLQKSNYLDVSVACDTNEIVLMDENDNILTSASSWFIETELSSNGNLAID